MPLALTSKMVPAHRAIKFRVAKRDVARICAEPLLTRAQLLHLADMIDEAVAERDGQQASA